MSVASWCCKSFCVVPCVSFCTGHFVMVPLNMIYIHCLQHSLFEHLFNLYWITWIVRTRQKGKITWREVQRQNVANYKVCRQVIIKGIVTFRLNWFVSILFLLKWLLQEMLSCRLCTVNDIHWGFILANLKRPTTYLNIQTFPYNSLFLIKSWCKNKYLNNYSWHSISHFP